MKLKVLSYKIRNLPNRIRGWRSELPSLNGLLIRSTLRMKIVRADGSIEDYGIVSKRVVTDAAAAYLVTVGNLLSTFNYHDCGTGTNAESVADTTLQTPYGGARTLGTQSNPSANVLRSIGTIVFTSSLSIIEHGLFSAAAAGTLLDRSKFTVQLVSNGDAITFTYDFTITSGG